jgi:hypothetical protein
VQPLPGGLLLVNDPGRRRLVLLDSAMKQVAVVADTTAATRNAYGANIGGLLPFRGDSALFVDPASLSMLVIAPTGKIARVMAAPRASDVFFLIGGPMGSPAFDAKGRLVYRACDMRGRGPRAPGQPMTPPVLPESLPLVRYDLSTRALDTAAFVKVYAPKFTVVQTEDGGTRMSSMINPMPEVDDWAVLSDGRIAILRKDYHVDFIDADGTRSSSPKIPFEWQRLTDSAKAAIIDSSKAAFERMRAGGASGAPGGGQMVMMSVGPGGPPPGGPPGGGAPMIVIREQRGGDAAPPPRGGPGNTARDAGPPPLSFVAPNELPDYQPAFSNGSVKADAEGKLWVRIMLPKPSTRPEYDVIDRTGKLVDRVQLPAGTTIAGFGPGGTVYLGVRDASGVHVVRAREK